MKFIKEILLFFVIIFVTKTYCNDDTVGRQFITSFLYKNPSNSSEMAFKLHFLPQNPGTTTVQINYYSLLKKNLTTITLNVAYNIYYEYTFVYKDVISDGHMGTGNVFDVIDPRLYILSSAPMKVLGSVTNIHNNQGDIYLVPPMAFAGKKYLLQLPTSVVLTNQLVHILTLPGVDASVNVIKTSNIGNVILNQTVTISGALGSNQKIIPITFNSMSPSIYISSNTSIVVVAAVTCANLNAYNNNNATSINNCDYAAFMPQQISTWDCSSNLTVADKRVISGDHTISVGISPADTTCGKNFPVLSYTNLNPINGLPNNLPSKRVSTFQFIHSLVNEYATESQNSKISLTRIGSPNANKNRTLDGIYMHYIPDVTQYYVGTTQFVSLYNQDLLEVYVENLKSNDTLTLNGINLSNSVISSRTIYSFGNTYTVLVFSVPNSSINTFSCTAKYVVYVISRGNKLSNTAYGYVAGFGTSQLTSNGGIKTTTVAPTYSSTNTIISQTTQKIDLSTKSSSKVIMSSLFLIFSLMMFLFINF